MRSHAKASTAGSTQRQTGRLGRFIRGAFAGRGGSSDGRGSGALATGRAVLPAGVFGAIVLVMALIAAPAGASKTHLFKETFGSAAQPSLGEARGMAVDQSSGDLLVMDSGGTDSIKRYNADGTPANFSALGTNVIDGQGTGDETPQNGLSFGGANELQIAIDNSGGATDGNIYVTQSSPKLINIFAEDGEYLGQLTAAGATPFSEACGVGVDPSGAVYVGDYSGGIHKFVPAANPPVNADNTAAFTSVTNPCTLAAGAGPTAGFLFAAQHNGPISKLDSSSGELKYTISADSTNNVTIAVDPTSGHVYGATGANTIYEFDASGAGSATQVSTFKSDSAPQGLAVNGGGEVYVSSTEFSNVVISNIKVFGPTVTVADVVTGSASNIEETTATLNGTVNPDGVALEECKFEYGTSTSYGQSVPCAESTGAIGTGTSPVPVHADISGLSISTTYHFRLVAKNANDTVEGNDGEFESLSTPAIKDQWAHDVIYTEATLKAKINPKGFASTYHIEYGPDTSYGQSTPEVGYGSDSTDHILTRSVAGLSPDTTYHYRFVATNAVGTTEGPDLTFTTYPPFSPDTNCANQSFRTGPALNMADCRAYEMVSPIDKNGGEITTGLQTQSKRTAYVQASLDGEKITYSSVTPFANQPSAIFSNQYLSTRGPDGWSTEGINAPQGTTIFDPVFNPFVENFIPRYNAFTEDLSSGWLVSFNRAPLTPDGQPNHINLYKRDNSDGSFEALTVNESLNPTNNIYGELAFELAENQGMTADGSHSLFAARAKFTPDASDSGNRQLYAFHDGEIELVSVLPNGEPSPTFTNDVGTQFIDPFLGQWRASVREDAISEDGSRIFWTAGSSTNYLSNGRLYVRVDGETTVPISSGIAQFWDATPDGSEVIFTEGSEGSFFAGSADLYTFDVEAETKTLIADNAYGVAGASEDLSYIYFSSREVLDAGADAGEVNFYVLHDGVTRFIATLSAGTVGEGRNFSLRRGQHSARVTPDGRHVAFEASVSLTGYDNTDTASGKPDSEAYIYDAETETLTCASCNPSGARPRGRPQPQVFVVEPDRWPEVSGRWSAAWLPTEESSVHSSRTLSDDGNRLFFNAFDALVPQDTNGVQDVYEWRRQGISGCQKPDGCVSLISTGESPRVSEFVEAGANGRDVFFETNASIHPEDTGLIDIYSARSGGGYPYAPPGIPCEGDACQSIPPAPNDATPASANFKGAGDPRPRKARARCKARNRKAAKGSSQKAKRKAAKRCSRAKRRAGR